MSKSKVNVFKQSFSLLEVIVALLLISLISYSAVRYYKPNSLDIVTKRLIIYLKQTRMQGMIDNHYSHEDSLWHKKRWTLKFFRCRASVGGLYYSIYSDENKTGHPSSLESLKDPLTKKYIYSSNSCAPTQYNSPYVLLTQQYDIEDVNISCNSTSSLGQLSFGADGKVYSKLSSEENKHDDFAIDKPCTIRITHKNGSSKEIIVENDTGYVYQK